RLALDSETRERDRFESRARDWFPRHLAFFVRPQLDALEWLIDFVKRVVLLRKQTHRKITIVSLRSRVGLVHTESLSCSALRAGAKRALGDAGHRIHHGVAKLEQFFFLLANKRIELPFTMVQAEQHRGRFRSLSSGFRRTPRRLCAACSLDHAGFLSAD